jgi:tRNA pseudouridine38-40 synthase
LRNLKLTIAYDGAHYRGWQIQPEGKTIQGVLEEKLGLITGEAVRLHAAGRTDAGVHALAQVANVTIQHHIPVLSLQKALNSMLPGDIAINDIQEVESDFQARYGAKIKTYVYRILQQPYPSPFERWYAWHIPRLLNLENMRRSAEHLLGSHNFASFQGSGCCAKNLVKTIHVIDFQQDNHILSIKIQGDGFLRHMVRNIVGTLVETGRGKLSPDDVKTILAARDRTQAGPTAPPQGLYLAKVEY